MGDRTLRNSEDWAKIFGITVLDPDGWDRQNFEHSWGELISEEEFSQRLWASTIESLPGGGEFIKTEEDA